MLGDGSVGTWEGPPADGDKCVDQDQLRNVKQIRSSAGERAVCPVNPFPAGGVCRHFRTMVLCDVGPPW